MRIGVHRICGVGDAVQMTPLLRQIRLDCPQAEVVCFISQNAAGVLEGCPWVDKLVSLPLEMVTPSRRNPGLWKMWSHIAAQGEMDLLLHLGRRWSHSLGALLVPARCRAGFSSAVKGRPQPFDVVIDFPRDPLQEKIHASQLYLDLWQRATGRPDRGLGSSLEHLGQDDSPRRLHGLPPDYLCFAPGAGNWLNPAENKRWPTRHWRRLMELAHSAGHAVALLGSQGDFPAEKCPAGVVDLTGKTTLAETASLLRHSRGFVGHDSGLFHMALGLQVPAAAFFGPTRADLTGPFRSPHSLVLRADLPCAPCCHPQCNLPEAEKQPVDGSPPCMSLIQPEAAWARIQPFFKEHAITA